MIIKIFALLGHEAGRCSILCNSIYRRIVLIPRYHQKIYRSVALSLGRGVLPISYALALVKLFSWVAGTTTLIIKTDRGEHFVIDSGLQSDLSLIHISEPTRPY